MYKRAWKTTLYKNNQVERKRARDKPGHRLSLTQCSALWSTVQPATEARARTSLHRVRRHWGPPTRTSGWLWAVGRSAVRPQGRPTFRLLFYFYRVFFYWYYFISKCFRKCPQLNIYQATTILDIHTVYSIKPPRRPCVDLSSASECSRTDLMCSSPAGAYLLQ